MGTWESPLKKFLGGEQHPCCRLSGSAQRPAAWTGIRAAQNITLGQAPPPAPMLRRPAFPASVPVATAVHLDSSSRGLGVAPEGLGWLQKAWGGMCDRTWVQTHGWFSALLWPRLPHRAHGLPGGVAAQGTRGNLENSRLPDSLLQSPLPQAPAFGPRAGPLPG